MVLKMRQDKSALLSVVVFVGLALVADAASSSNDTDQAGQQGLSPNTSLKNNDHNATSDDTELMPGSSRTGLGGDNVNR
jgi:hypothetical protein